VQQKSGAWKRVFIGGEVGRKDYRFELDSGVAQPSVGRHEYTLKIEILGKSVLKGLHLRSCFSTTPWPLRILCQAAMLSRSRS
jgi:hypothetical protein